MNTYTTYANGTAALQFPSHYVPLTEEEMTYVDGGVKCSVLSGVIDGLVILVGGISYGVAKMAMRQFVWGPKWAEVISKIAPKIAKYAGSSAAVSAACRALDVSYYLDFCSIGGFIAYGIDRWVDKGAKRNDGRVFE